MQTSEKKVDEKGNRRQVLHTVHEVERAHEREFTVKNPSVKKAIWIRRKETEWLGREVEHGKITLK